MTPDISLCLWGAKCPLSPYRYRATATPDEVRQSYFAPSRNGQECPYFIHAKPNKEKA